MGTFLNPQSLTHTQENFNSRSVRSVSDDIAPKSDDDGGYYGDTAGQYSDDDSHGSDSDELHGIHGILQSSSSVGLRSPKELPPRQEAPTTAGNFIINSSSLIQLFSLLPSILIE